MGSDAILEQLEREGSWGKYTLVRPRGGGKGEAIHRSAAFVCACMCACWVAHCALDWVVARYLTEQGQRREEGLPRELEVVAQAIAPPAQVLPPKIPRSVPALAL